jgi:hypothetical protein
MCTFDPCEVGIGRGVRRIEVLALVVDRVSVAIEQQGRERVTVGVVRVARFEWSPCEPNLDRGQPVLAASARHATASTRDTEQS